MYFLLFPILSLQGGVQRVHLLDGTIGGVLLLELFQRDGVGTMVARYMLFFVGCIYEKCGSLLGEYKFPFFVLLCFSRGLSF